MDAKQMEGLLNGLNLDKAEISKMIDTMAGAGQITPEQAKKVKAELNGISDEKLQNFNDIAKQKIRSGEADKLIKTNFNPQNKPVQVQNNQQPSTSSSRAPASAPQAAPAPNTTIDFSKLGQ